MSIQSETQAVVSQELHAAVADFMTKFNAGDLDAVMELQTDDCMVMPPFGPVASGKDEVRAFWTNVVKNIGMADITYRIEKVEALSRDIASELTTFEGTIAGVRQAGKYCVIWKRENGRWKLHHDTFNAAPVQ